MPDTEWSMHFPLETVIHGVGVYTQYSIQVLYYNTAHPASLSTNPMSIFYSSVSIRTCVLVKSWIPIEGSENMAPVTIIQIYRELNQLFWTPTGILIPISISYGGNSFQVPKNFWNGTR